MVRDAEQLRLDMPVSNDHYLEAVTDLGDTEDISASENIYSESGVLLLSKGSRINSKVYDSLSKHSLQNDVDGYLCIGDAITNARLFQELKRQIDLSPVFTQWMEAIPNPMKLEDYLRHIYLDDMMRSKVTVAYKSFPDLFVHSLRVAIGAAMIGILCKLSDEECEHLATAGLFHDLGNMHLPPVLSDAEHSLSEGDRRAIYTHPLVMFNILKQSDVYHPHISVPVLEHHERVNGSGYPRETLGYTNKVSAVLSFAEVVVSMRARYSSKRVWMGMLSQTGLYDSDVIKAIANAKLQLSSEEEGEVSADGATLTAALTMLQLIISQWNELHTGLDQDNLTNLQKQLAMRVQHVEMMLARGGVLSTCDDTLALFDGDEVIMQEAYYLLEEALFGVRELYLEVVRKFDDKDIEAAGDAVKTWIEMLGKQVDAFGDL
jgi:hypothetical protein